MLIFKSLPAKMETMLYARLALVKCPVSIARHSPIWPITCSPVLQKVRVSIAVNVTMRVKCKIYLLSKAHHLKTIIKRLTSIFCLHVLLKQYRKLQGGKLKSLYTSLVVVNGRASESAP